MLSIPPFVSSSVLLLGSMHSWSLEDSMGIKHLEHVSVCPEGRRIVCTVTEALIAEEKSGWLSHIYMTQNNGQFWKKLTDGEDSCLNPQWSPDGKWIAFIKNNNLWIMPEDGGGMMQLTDVITSIETFIWSPDSAQIAFVVQDPVSEKEYREKKEKKDPEIFEKEEHFSHLWLVSLNANKETFSLPVRLTDGNYHLSTDILHNHLSWSPDGTRIAFDAALSSFPDDISSCSIYDVDIKNKHIRHLIPRGGTATQPFYSPDGKWLAYCYSGSPFKWAMSSAVCIIPADGGIAKRLSLTFNEDVQGYGKIIGWSADSKNVYILESKGTSKQIYSLPIDGSPPDTLDLEGNLCLDARINASHQFLSFSAESLYQPPEAYYLSLVDRKLRHVSHFNPIVQKCLPRTEMLRWTSFDGLEIEGLLTYPVDYKQGQSFPLLLIIHGGPMAHFQQCFIGNPLKPPMEYPVAAFASRGYAVLRANPRGSTGYGKAFRFANYGDWAGKDFEDLMSGVDAIINLGIADPNRLGIMGWSYGGYLTAWAITHSDRFKAASIGAGAVNILSFMGTIDIPSLIADYFKGEITEKLQEYLERSPILYVGKACTPTLLQYGEKDRRGPVSQGHELFRALKRQNVPTELVIYPRMGHHTQETKLLLDIQERNLTWFDQFLKSD